MAKIRYIDRILIVLNPDGTLRGAAQYPITTWDDPDIPDKTGDAEPISVATLTAVLPSQSAGIAQLALAAQHATEAAAREQELAVAIAALQAEVDTLTATVADQIATIQKAIDEATRVKHLLDITTREANRRTE